MRAIAAGYTQTKMEIPKLWSGKRKSRTVDSTFALQRTKQEKPNVLPPSGLLVSCCYCCLRSMCCANFREIFINFTITSFFKHYLIATFPFCHFKKSCINIREFLITFHNLPELGYDWNVIILLVPKASCKFEGFLINLPKGTWDTFWQNVFSMVNPEVPCDYW